MIRACTTAALLPLLACCGDGHPEGPVTSSGKTPPQAEGAAEANLETLRRYRAAAESKDFEGLRALFADDFRQSGGAKFGQGVSRDEIFELIRRSMESNATLPAPQLLIADDSHGLVLSLDTETRGGKNGGPYPMLRLYRLVDGKFSSRTLWYDVMTVYHQLGAPSSEGGPEREAPWPEVVEIAARGDEREASQVARTRALVDAIGAGDARAAAALVADGFTDRDLTEEASRTFATPSEFEDATREWLALSDVSIVRTQDVWSAGPYAVAQLSRSFRLRSDLPGFPGTAGHEAHAYQLWLLRFDDDGKISARWQMRSRLHERMQLEILEIRSYMAAVSRALSR